MVEAREGAVATTIPSGQVSDRGGSWGYANQTSAELFSPVTDTFSAARPRPGQSPTEIRDRAVAATLPSGQVLIAGGHAGHLESPLSSAELFVPAGHARHRARAKQVPLSSR